MNLYSQIWKPLVTAMHPPKYILASLVVCIGGLLNGLDTGTIGPITTMPQFTQHFSSTHNLSPLARGLTISSVLLSATFASMFAGTVSDTMGRSRAVGIGAAAFTIGAVLEAAAVDYAMLIVGRLVVGVGEGLFLSTLVVYICEISPPGKRGPLASMVQVSITIGLCIGYFMCYGTVKLASSISWRFPLGIQAGIAVVLALAARFCLPESPRWLAHRGRSVEAARVWEELGVSISERDDRVAVGELEVEEASPGGLDAPSLRARLRERLQSLKVLFTTEAKTPMYLGVFLMSMQQLSGIDGVLYYAPLLFQQAGLSSSKASFLASGVSAILICITSIPAFLLADKWGRRASTIHGGLVLSSSMIIIGALYASNSVREDAGAARWMVIVSIYVFAIAYCMTWALSIKVFASEIQHIRTRATATSLSQSANCITNFLVAFITPVLLNSSSSAVYFLFAGCSLVTVLVCLVAMPETKMESLEWINVTFQNRKVREAQIIRVPLALLDQMKKCR